MIVFAGSGFIPDRYLFRDRACLGVSTRWGMKPHVVELKIHDSVIE